MPKEPVQINRLAIRKMPAFKDGLPALEGLAKHINIIAGPNASGKTSSARAIQNLLFQNKEPATEVKAELTIQGKQWQIEVSSGQPLVQKEGVDASLSDFPSRNEQNRYSLSLHELVTAEGDGDLAKQIYDQTMGFDFDKPKDRLGYQYPNPRGDNSYKEAFNQVQQVKKQQRELAEDEQRLHKLYEDRGEADKAQRLHRLYQLVKEYKEAYTEWQNSREQFDEYPENLKNTRENDFEELEEKEKSIREKQSQKGAIERKIETAKQTIAELNLPDEGIANDTLEKLKQYRDKISDKKGEIDRLSDKISEAKAREKEALHELGDDLDPSSWEGISPIDIRGVDEFLQKAHQVQSKKQYLQTRMDTIENQLDPDTILTDTDQLKEAINALSHWLTDQQGSNQEGPSLKWLFIIAGLAVSTSLLAFWNTWLAVLGGVAALIAAYLAYSQANQQGSDRSTLREEDYRQTGFDEPEAWTIEEVSKKVKELSDSLATVQRQQELQEDKNKLAEDLNEAEQNWKKIKEEKEQWRATLQAFPGLPDDQLDNFSGMYHFLTRLKDWQDAHTNLAALENQLKQRENELQETLDTINAEFERLGRKKADDGETAIAYVHQLLEDAQTWNNDNQTLRDKSAQLKEYENEIQELRDQLNAIYDRLQVERGDKEAVRKLVNQLADYQQAGNALDVANRALCEKTEAMERHSYYHEQANIIETLSWDEVEQTIQQYGEKADERDGIQKQISDIEARVNAQKQRMDLTEALRNKDNVLSKLQDDFQENLKKLTGALLTDTIKQHAQEQYQPPVQQKANELLSRITQGRYQLRLDDSRDSPSFRAFDTVLQKGQALNELSSGTRIQLLLSVRLAFLEIQETHYKLPILADEVLANSDDDRAKAIIDALVAISRDGRQVFYFTARSDEVAKWQKFLQGHDDVGYTIKYLTGEEQFDPGGIANRVDKQAVQLENQVPEPYGLEYSAYGAKLGVPAFDLLTQNANQLHLWYLLTDSEALYHCLSRGIRFWGQLEEFAKHNGSLHSLGITDYQKLADKAQLLKRFQEEYNIGRSKPIDRQVLEDSRAITNTFMDTITAKLHEWNNNPAQLVEALKNGTVKRFNKNKAQELETYLIDQGYLADQEPQAPETIQAKINAFVSKSKLSQQEAQNFIDSLFTKLENANG